MTRVNFSFCHTVAQCGILRIFVSRYFCAKWEVFFREIEVLMDYRVKIVLQNSIFDIFGAKMRNSRRNMPKSRRFEDFKLGEKPGIHWTQTEISECKVANLQLPTTAY